MVDAVDLKSTGIYSI